jgi:hypothetical protein
MTHVLPGNGGEVETRPSSGAESLVLRVSYNGKSQEIRLKQSGSISMYLVGSRECKLTKRQRNGNSMIE